MTIALGTNFPISHPCGPISRTSKDLTCVAGGKPRTQEWTRSSWILKFHGREVKESTKLHFVLSKAQPVDQSEDSKGKNKR